MQVRLPPVVLPSVSRPRPRAAHRGLARATARVRVDSRSVPSAEARRTRPAGQAGRRHRRGEARTMEILGIGTDIVECPRIGKMIEQHGELFLRRIYTEREIRYCQARKHAIEHFAGRWAAKEAILKAMGTGRSRGIAWTHVEVRNGPDGRPQVMICGAAREVARERQHRRDPGLDLALPDLRHRPRPGPGPSRLHRQAGRSGTLLMVALPASNRGSRTSIERTRPRCDPIQAAG